MYKDLGITERIWSLCPSPWRRRYKHLKGAVNANRRLLL